VTTKVESTSLSSKLGAQVVLEVALRPDELDVSTIIHYPLVLLELEVILPVNIGEAPLLGDNDLLATRELITGTAESLLDHRSIVILAADGHDDLANVHTSDGSIGLAPSTTHTGLQTIGTSTGQHLVDADDMERVDADSQMERILARGLGDVFVGADTSSFEGFTRKLLVFIGDEMAAEGEVINGSTLAAQIENANLGIWHTTVVPGFRIGLVLAVAVAASGTATHFFVSMPGVTDG